MKPFPGAKLEASALSFNKIDPFHPFRLAVDEREALQEIFQPIRVAVRDLRKAGAPWHHINSLTTWREVGFYDARERAALNWAESLTRLVEHHGDRDADFAQLQAVFSDTEIVDLTVLIAQINAWNRLGVGMHLPVADKPID